MDFRNLNRTWIVAEIGVNHEGDPKLAAEMIRLAAEAGVDAVKFQTFTAENYISTVQPERRARAARFALAHDAFCDLAEEARRAGVTFFSTPLHADDVDFLDPLVPLFKISSGDLTHHALLEHVARKGKPIILSTGLGTLAEIRDAVDVIVRVRPEIVAGGELALLHCVAAYPTAKDEVNLRNVAWLRDTFGLPVGFSDHTLPIRTSELAVAAGATIVEKHFTYRREGQTFHDHHLSLEPREMKQLVEAIREVETALGRRERVRVPSEEKMLYHLRRSVAAAVAIPNGTPVRAEWLTHLRPAWGIPSNEVGFVVGRKLKRDVPAGDLIRPEDVEI